MISSFAALFGAALLLFVQPASAQSNSSPQCLGRFNGQPCLTTNGTSGACIGLLPPCAVGFECKPYYNCDPEQKPLSNHCSQEGAHCLVGDATQSFLGSCIVQSPCPNGGSQCPVSLICATAGTTTHVATASETTNAETTTVTAPWPTIIVPDQNRAQACREKSEGAACTIGGKQGKCSFAPPTPNKQKRVPAQLQCFESSTDGTVAIGACANKMAGDACGEGARCSSSDGGALKCVMLADEPNASSLVTVSYIVAIGALVSNVIDRS